MSGPGRGEDVRAFYDDLAEEYHLIYDDWWASVERQARALDGIVAARLGPGPKRILDCTCGIGTQALGLAARGHEVTGTDVSEGAVARARAEARARGLELMLRTWDVREIAHLPGGPWDVVLSADNSLPHLLGPEDLEGAARGMWRQAAPGGVVLVTVRDYDALTRDRPRVEGPRLLGAPGERRVVLQLWDWAEDGRTYELDHLLLRETDGDWRVSSRRATYRALGRSELEAAFRAAGAGDAGWLEPADSGFFQPVLQVPRGGELR